MVQGRLSPLLYHPLDPLNHIDPAIAVQFADLVEQLSIIRCRHLIDTVRDELTAAVAKGNPFLCLQTQLYQYKGKLRASFAFDPYCLGRSRSYLNLDETYITWNEVKRCLPDQDTVIEGRFPSKTPLYPLLFFKQRLDEEELLEGCSWEDDFSPGYSLPLRNGVHSLSQSDR